MTADEFTAEMLAELRREFFKTATDRQFYQERNLLLQAIAAPARYMNDFDAKALPSKYQAILRTVIRAIKTKGNRAKIHRFSVYFLHCVQEHMRHHGDRYRAEAKIPRGVIGPLVNRELRRLQNAEGTDATAILAGTHRPLRLQSGRKRAAAPAQPELFV